MNEVRLIDVNALKEAIRKRLGISSLKYLTEQEKVIVEEIDNAPTVPLPDFKEGYKQAIIDGKTNFSRPQGEWLSHYDYCEKHGYNPSVSIAFWWCDRCEQAVEHPTNFCPNCGADMRKGGAE